MPLVESEPQALHSSHSTVLLLLLLSVAAKPLQAKLHPLCSTVTFHSLQILSQRSGLDVVNALCDLNSRGSSLLKPEINVKVNLILCLKDRMLWTGSGIPIHPLRLSSYFPVSSPTEAIRTGFLKSLLTILGPVTECFVYGICLFVKGLGIGFRLQIVFDQNNCCVTRSFCHFLYGITVGSRSIWSSVGARTTLLCGLYTIIQGPTIPFEDLRFCFVTSELCLFISEPSVNLYQGHKSFGLSFVAIPELVLLSCQKLESSGRRSSLGSSSLKKSLTTSFRRSRERSLVPSSPRERITPPSTSLCERGEPYPVDIPGIFGMFPTAYVLLSYHESAATLVSTNLEGSNVWSLSPPKEAFSLMAKRIGMSMFFDPKTSISKSFIIFQIFCLSVCLTGYYGCNKSFAFVAYGNAYAFVIV